MQFLIKRVNNKHDFYQISNRYEKLKNFVRLNYSKNIFVIIHRLKNKKL